MHNIEDFPLPCDQPQPLPGSSQQPSFFFAGLLEPLGVAGALKNHAVFAIARQLNGHLPESPSFAMHK